MPIFSSDESKVIGTLGVGKVVQYEFTDEEKERLAKLGEEMRELL